MWGIGMSLFASLPVHLDVFAKHGNPADHDEHLDPKKEQRTAGKVVMPSLDLWGWFIPCAIDKGNHHDDHQGVPQRFKLAAVFHERPTSGT